MTITDLIKDFIDTSKERLKTPISGAFLWSFIIYNWRPIVLLLFSKSSIENKIIVINHEYCNFWALFWPVVIATYYTLLLPKIMLFVDRDLAPTKDERVTKRYEAKKHLVEQKTTVASLEFVLKNVESGSKQIEDLLLEIESYKLQINNLQESIKHMNDSHTITMEELNKELKLSNENSAQLQKLRSIQRHEEQMRIKLNKFLNRVVHDVVHLDTKTNDEILNISKSLDFNEYELLENMELGSNGFPSFNGTLNIEESINSLVDKKILKYEVMVTGNRSLRLTQLGHIIYDIIKSI